MEPVDGILKGCFLTGQTLFIATYRDFPFVCTDQNTGLIFIKKVDKDIPQRYLWNQSTESLKAVSLPACTTGSLGSPRTANP